MDRPWLKFYVKDYAGDSKLKRCSLSAQGLWMRIMCEMHDSPIYGKLQYDRMIGKPIKKPASADDSEIVELWATCERLALDCLVMISEFKPLMTELIENQVAKIDPHGNLFSYRMVKDHDISIKRSNATISRRTKKTSEPELFPEDKDSSEAVNGNTSNNLPSYAQTNTRKPKMLDPSEYLKEFMDDKMWAEQLMMAHKIREGDIKKRIGEFAEINTQSPQLLTDGKREKEDAKSHFTNWLRKQLQGSSATNNKSGIKNLKSGRIEVDSKAKSHGRL